MSNQPTAAQQVQQAVAQLHAARARKEALTEQLEAVQLQITALRNVVEGIAVGRQLEAEVRAERAAAETAAQVPA